MGNPRYSSGLDTTRIQFVTPYHFVSFFSVSQKIIIQYASHKPAKDLIYFKRLTVIYVSALCSAFVNVQFLSLSYIWMYVYTYMLTLYFGLGYFYC